MTNITTSVAPVGNAKCYVADILTLSQNSYDLDGDLCGSYITGYEVHIFEYEILRETKCGFWYKGYDKYGISCERFVNDSWTKKSAYRTVEEAVYGLLKKKESHQYHLKNKLARVYGELQELKKYIGNPFVINPNGSIRRTT